MCALLRATGLAYRVKNVVRAERRNRDWATSSKRLVVHVYWFSQVKVELVPKSDEEKFRRIYKMLRPKDLKTVPRV